MHHGNIGRIEKPNNDFTAAHFQPLIEIGKEDAFYRKYILIRDGYFELVEKESSAQREYPMLRASLNNEYEEFISTYGILNHPQNRKRILEDTAFGLTVLSSLERNEDDTFRKADILERTLIEKNEMFFTDDPSEALARCLNEKGMVDISYIGKVTGLINNQVIERLGDNIYLNPLEETWETADQYLSGNVVSKLIIAKEKAEKHPEDAPGFYAGNSGAALSTTMGNSQIQWEATTMADYGMDLTFFNGRMNFTADYYTKTTDQLLYNKQLPLETGAKSVTINLGTIVNSGLEFTLGGTSVKTKDFEWNTVGNISFQEGKIKSLANHVSFISGNKWLIQEGGKIGDFYVFKNLGVYKYDESNAYDDQWNQLTPIFDQDGKFAGFTEKGKTYTGTVHSLYSSTGNKLKGGETIWQNTYIDSVIDDRDRVIAGNGIPKYYFGFINNFRYKNLTLSVMLNGALGYQIYNKVKNDQNTFSSTYSPPTWDAVLYSWHQPGDNVPYPDFKKISKDVNGDVRSGMNSLYLEDGSFIRLSSARLAYTLDGKFAGKMKMKSATVYIFGDNLLTWTKYSWYDPEFSSKGLNIGEDGGKYPKRKEIGLGINLNF